MTLRRKRAITAVAALGGAVLALVAMAPLFIRDMSPVTAGMLEGAVGVVCLIGIAYGVWDSRRIEAKREAKEQIWIKH